MRTRMMMAASILLAVTSVAVHGQRRVVQIGGATGDFSWTQVRQEALALSRLVGDDIGVAQSLGNLALGDLSEGRLEQAASRLREALDLRDRLKDRSGKVITLVNLSYCQTLAGDFEDAVRYLEEALSIARAIGGHDGIGAILNNLAELARRGGDPARARSLWVECFQYRHSQR